MAKGINDLDFEDDIYSESTETVQIEQNQDVQIEDTDNKEEDKNINNSEPIDIFSELLKTKGISDPTKIKFEDEDGELQELDFNNLSDEEKLNILRSSDEDVDYGLDENEISFINYLRSNDITADEYINYIKQQAINEYKDTIDGNPQYSIDSLSDDELYIADLQARVKDITEDEIEKELIREKENPELFAKKMQGIRNEYITLEKEQQELEEKAAIEEQQENFNKFSNTVYDAIGNLKEIGGIELELDEDDSTELANFILSSDAAGISYLGKALDDPQTLVKMAWFALKGDEALETINEYYKKEMKAYGKSQYELGLQGADKNKNKKSTVSITDKTSNKKIININDLDF